MRATVARGTVFLTVQSLNCANLKPYQVRVLLELVSEWVDQRQNLRIKHLAMLRRPDEIALARVPLDEGHEALGTLQLQVADHRPGQEGIQNAGKLAMLVAGVLHGLLVVIAVEQLRDVLGARGLRHGVQGEDEDALTVRETCQHRWQIMLG